MENKLKDKHLCIFSFTLVSDEPRVLRQARALHEKGAKVTVVGYQGKAPVPDFWNFIDVTTPTLSLLKRLKRLSNPSILNKAIKRHISALFIGLILPFKYISSTRALKHYWAINGYEGIFERLPDIKADFYIAHDYFTLPIAYAFAEKNKELLSIDCHEHATTQYQHSLWFRLFQAPWVHALQKFLFPKVDCITVVCDGIGELLRKEYHLKKRPTTIRSIPYYQKCLFKPTNPESIKVLYHGCIAPKRGLEEIIQSIPLWEERFSLIIRGPGNNEYVEQLKEEIVALKVENRVIIEDPVPSFDLIKRANQDADIGYFAQPQFSPQKKYTLPNKFFEYIMAGICIVINEAQEMKKICDEYALGNFIKDLTPQGIANTINSLTAEQIDQQKKKSLLAAKTLCFEAESEKMLNLYNELF